MSICLYSSEEEGADRLDLKVKMSQGQRPRQVREQAVEHYFK